jgi:transcriptional regulator with XRE-family HTH domain
MNKAARLRLRVVRETQGKSLRDVEATTGFDRGYISKVERGLVRPSVDFLSVYARELGLTDVAEAIDRVWP